MRSNGIDVNNLYEYGAAYGVSPKGSVASSTEGGFAQVLRLASGQDAPQDFQRQQQALKQAALDLEALFVGQVLSAMRRTVPEAEGLFQQGRGEKMFRDMLDGEMSQSIAAASDLGLANAIYTQLAAGLGTEPSKK